MTSSRRLCRQHDPRRMHSSLASFTSRAALAILLACLFAVGGCALSNTVSPGGQATTETSGTTKVPAVTSLAGAAQVRTLPTSVTDRTWTLVHLTQDGRAVPLVADHPVTLLLRATPAPGDMGDTFGGVSACNGYGGSYAVDGQALHLRVDTVSFVLCLSPVGEVEQAYHESVAQVASYRLTTDRELLLISGDGKTVLTFAARKVG
jgi:heat shock protein HslJ